MKLTAIVLGIIGLILLAGPTIGLIDPYMAGEFVEGGGGLEVAGQPLPYVASWVIGLVFTLAAASVAGKE